MRNTYKAHQLKQQLLKIKFLMSLYNQNIMLKVQHLKIARSLDFEIFIK